jgi:hypothetical protein
LVLVIEMSYTFSVYAFGVDFYWCEKWHT